LTFHRIRVSWAGLLAVSVATLTTVLALYHGIISVDVARDLYQAQLIRDGVSFPISGPPINGSTVLGPVWYYALAVATWLGGSLAAAFALMGLALSLKYVFAYCVGAIWRNDAFATMLVCAMAFPGVASYALLGVGHPSFVETFLWAAALFSLLAVRDRNAWFWVALAGLANSLALHAHPTAIVLVATIAVTVFFVLWRIGTRGEWLRAAVVFSFAFILPFLPLAYGFYDGRASFVSTSVAEAARSWPSALVILKNMLWHQPLMFAHSYGIVELLGESTWRVIWSAVLVAIIAGAAIALSQRRSRKPLLLSIFALSVTVLAVGLLRNGTPFYMLYVALPVFCVAIALSWECLHATRNRSLVVIACAALLAAQSLIAYGLVDVSRRGLHDSRLPLGSDLQKIARERQRHPTTSAPTRDAFARWLCGREDTITLHGSLAAALDLGLGVELPLACKSADMRIGGKLKLADPTPTGTHWIGLPSDVWRELAIAPEVSLHGAGLARVSAMHSPERAMQVADGEQYPPRLDEMVAALQDKTWQIEFVSVSTDVVSVAALIPLLSEWRVEAKANGNAVDPLQVFGSNLLYRCHRCAQDSQTVWSIRINGAPPGATSIVTVSATLPK
jgi:hypothetical protein